MNWVLSLKVEHPPYKWDTADRYRQDLPNNMAIHSIFSSDGTHLIFPTRKDYNDYNSDIQEVVRKHYIKIRQKYGIWASNQGKFVNNIEELNELDNKFMEDTYGK